MTHRAGRTVIWLLGLLGAGIALRLAATGDLAAPPLGPLDELADWVDAREPAAASIAVARALTEIGVWYVLAVSALHAASSAMRIAAGHRLADALALPAVRRAVRAGLGLGLAAASSVGARHEVGAAEAVTAAPADGVLVDHAVLGERDGTATMRPQVPERSGPAATLIAPAPATWTVAPGDSFWSIAEELLTDAWSRPPIDAEIDPFWRLLVERNRGRLVDPVDPDLIHPGQVFEVPPLPSSAT